MSKNIFHFGEASCIAEGRICEALRNHKRERASLLLLCQKGNVRRVNILKEAGSKTSLSSGGGGGGREEGGVRWQLFSNRILPLPINTCHTALATSPNWQGTQREQHSAGKLKTLLIRHFTEIALAIICYLRKDYDIQDKMQYQCTNYGCKVK